MRAGGSYLPQSPFVVRPLGVRAVVLRAVAIVLAGLLSAGAGRAADPPSEPTTQGRLAYASIRESSGLIASGSHPGVYWTHNDSGGGTWLFAHDASGKHVGRVRVTGAKNVDWEDIAIDGKGRLVIADVGDNRRVRPVVTLYTVAEPDPRRDRQVRVESTLKVTYPAGHGPMDCEGVFVRDGWAYLVSKDFQRARMYRVRLGGGPRGPRRAEHVGTIPDAAWITAADIAPGGRHLALLSYSALYVYDLPAPLGQAVTTAPAESRPAGLIRVRPRKRLLTLRQAEAVCWMSGRYRGDLLISNEQRGLFRVTALRRPTTSSRPAGER